MTTAIDPRTQTSAPETAPFDRRRANGIPGALVIATAAVLIGVQFVGSGPAVDDGSHQAAETQRMNALAPVSDGSFDTAEFVRQAGFALADASHDVAERQRFLSVGPALVTSFETAEHTRQLRLAPAADVSHEAAELDRMIALQP